MARRGAAGMLAIDKLCKQHLGHLRLSGLDVPLRMRTRTVLVGLPRWILFVPVLSCAPHRPTTDHRRPLCLCRSPSASKHGLVNSQHPRLGRAARVPVAGTQQAARRLGPSRLPL